MKKILIALSLFLSFGSLSCDFEQVSFDTDFDGGRLNQCKKINDTTYQLLLKPENTPINDSPWYAFKVKTKTPTKLNILMKVKGGQHRYPPKLTYDGNNWQLLTANIRKGMLKFSIPASSQVALVSAQEVISNDFYVKWGKSLAEKGVAKHFTLGASREERDINALSTNSNAKQWLLILGRQHPPEITGALALFPFVETLLSDSKTAIKFRSKFNVLVVPNLNPDGVHKGNWRHNANGKDLNRQWRRFIEPEVKLIHQHLSSMVERGQKIAFAVDFHSTHKDIFYTMPSDYDVEQRFLTENWLSLLDENTPGFNVIQRPGNNPGKGVFKQYIADKYKVHAITYEMGDHTDRQFIDDLAKQAANTLMTSMMKNNSRKR